MKKKYFILKILNRNHNFILRILIGLISSFCVYLITRSYSLAKTSFNDFFKNDFKMGLRRFLKILEIYLEIKLVSDITVNFCESITEKGLLDLWHKFRNIERKSNKLSIKSNYLCVIAALIELNHKNQVKLINQFNKYSQDIINFGNKMLENKILLKKSIKKSNPKKGDFNKLNAKSALEEWSILFPNDKFKWFVISGTFLGLIREGDFLKHDVDIDIGIHFKDLLFDEIISKIKKSKLFFIKKIEYLNQGYFINDKYLHSDKKKLVLIKVIHKTGLNIDLFIHYNEQEICWHGSSCFRWDNHLFELKGYCLNEIEVLGPKNAELYLTENYGKWRIPITNFSFTSGTPNLSISRNLTSIAMLLINISMFTSEESFLKNKYLLYKLNILSKDEIFDLRFMKEAKK